jgi:hypothetical protein
MPYGLPGPEKIQEKIHINPIASIAYGRNLRSAGFSGCPVITIPVEL